MTTQKHFLWNGEKYFVTSELTLFQLLHYFGYNTSLLVLEYNNYIWNKKNWDQTWIKDGDKIEIVTIVGGG